ncbi:ArsR family transcriptional regulator [Paraburkholderia caballeronis]|nr:ArsR family transcriptional regulator [Paraburkholderia caballeronis]
MQPSQHMSQSINPNTAEVDVDAIHKALANPVRREILAWLRDPRAHFADQELSLDHGVCAGRIDAQCGLSQSTVSAHLAALQKAGLVTSKRVGQWVFFKRNEPVIQAFLARVNAEL